MPRVAILGGGITGLTAGVLLAKRNIEVVVLEKQSRAGGAVQSIRRDGFIAEAGPNTLLINQPEIESILTDIGAFDHVLPVSPAAKKRFIVRAAQPVAVPMSPVQFLSTPLFSARAKCRLLAEPFIRRRADHLDDESLADFTRRRLGSEVLDYAVNPFVAGVYAGDPEKLSVRHAFSKLWEMERDGGSLFRGAIRLARQRKRSGRPRYRTRSVSFDNGLQVLPDILASRLGSSLVCSAAVAKIEYERQWKIAVSVDAGPPRPESFDAVILALPARALASLPFASLPVPDWPALGSILYPPVASVALGFKREDVAHPCDGFGALVPANEDVRILGTLFSSSLFPGRAPDGMVLLTSFVGGTRAPHLTALGTEPLEALVREELKRLLGVRGEPVFRNQTIWPAAIPQYNLGYDRYLSLMTSAEAHSPGLFIGGHCRNGISLGNCLLSGRRLAEAVAHYLGGPA